MKLYNEEYYNDWLSDNIFDLRIEFVNLNKDEFIKFCSMKTLVWNSAFSRREFTDDNDNFLDYCKEQFKLYCEERE